MQSYCERVFSLIDRIAPKQDLSCCSSRSIAMRRNKATGSITLHPKHQQHHRDSTKREIAAIWRPTNLRMKRAILQKRGPTTPVPSWKLYENPFYDGVVQTGATATGQENSVSARKLAASLWELQEIPLCKTPPSEASGGRPQPLSPDECTACSKKELLLPVPMPYSSTKRSSKDHAVKSTDNNGRIAYTSRQLAAMQSHISRLLDKQTTAKTSNGKGSTNHGSDTERQISETSVDKQIHLEGLSPSSALLQRLLSLEEQNTSSTSLATTLRAELDLARSRVKELEGANKLARREIENLLKKIAEDKAASYSKEQERIKQALQSIKDEADEERKSKRRMELSNRKLLRELGEAKMALSKAVQDLEKERKARELMEEVCDELAREIADDKAEVEELKRDSARIKQEVEDERKMLQVAEAWREERVQMKLAEARHEIQDKLIVLDSLRTKLEDFLKCRRRVMDDGDYASQQADIREAEMLRAAVDSVLLQERIHKPSEMQRPDDMESLDDDLHSIDLTKDVSHSKDIDKWQDRHIDKPTEKLSWKKLVEHKQKMLEQSRMYCSPNESSGEHEADERSQQASDFDFEGSAGKEGTGAGRTSGFKQDRDINGSLNSKDKFKCNGYIGAKSTNNSMGTYDTTDTCTVTSSEFELPLQKIKSVSSEAQSSQKQQLRFVASSIPTPHKSLSNERNNGHPNVFRGLKSSIEWSKIGSLKSKVYNHTKEEVTQVKA